MNLILQIESLALSFLFGMFFCLLYNLLYFILYTKYRLVNYITNYLFSLIMFGGYFILLYKINNGIIHPYFIVFFILGFFLYCKVFVKLRISGKKGKKIN